MLKLKHNSKIIKSINNDRKRQEKLLFFSLCPEQDIKLLNGEETMTLKDYQRITYLLYSLGLYEYYTEVTMQFHNLLKQEAAFIEESLRTPENCTQKVIECSSWLLEFCRQLPTDKLRHYFYEMFELHNSN